MSNIETVVGEPVAAPWPQGWPLVTDDDVAAMVDAIHRGDLGIEHSALVVRGAAPRIDHNAQAEAKFERVFGIEPVLCPTGTDAVGLLLQAFQIDHGVIVGPAGTWGMGTYGRALQRGLTVRVVDSEFRTWGTDPVALEAAMDDQVAAVLHAPMYGANGAVDELRAIAHQWGVPFLIDGAHAQVARHGGKHLALSCDAMATSFQSSKGPITLGEGGAVFAADPSVRATLERLVYTSRQVPGAHALMGTNTRMPRSSAALLESMLDHVPGEVALRESQWPELDTVMRKWGWTPQEHRRGEAQYKHASLRGDDGLDGISTPTVRQALWHLTGAPFEVPYPGTFDDPTWQPESVTPTRVVDDPAHRQELDATREVQPKWAKIARDGGTWPHEALLHLGFPRAVNDAFERIHDYADALRAYDAAA